MASVDLYTGSLIPSRQLHWMRSVARILYWGRKGRFGGLSSARYWVHQEEM